MSEVSLCLQSLLQTASSINNSIMDATSTVSKSYKQTASEVQKESLKDVVITEVQLGVKKKAPNFHPIIVPVNANLRNNSNNKLAIFELCTKCRKPIGYNEEDARISSKTNYLQNWHAECFHCNKCKVSLISQPFYQQKKALLCAKCMDECFSDFCARCHLEINRYSQDEKQLSSMDGSRHWHTGCYTCYKCNKSLRAGAGVYCHEDDDGLFCRECYDEIKARVCTKCKRRILRFSKEEKLISSPDGLLHWHEWCFKCSGCHYSLLELGGYYRHIDGGMYCEMCHLKNTEN